MTHKNIRRHACHHITDQSAANARNRSKEYKKKRPSHISFRDPFIHSHNCKHTQAHRVHHQHYLIIDQPVLSFQQFLFPVHYGEHNTGCHSCHNGIYGILKHSRRHDSQNDISGRSTSHGCHHAQNTDPENIHSSLCSYHCSRSSECNRSRHFQNKCK